MVNINGTQWEDLKSSDLEALLDGNEEESIFFEFKSDDEEPSKLMKEISALSNTYGGYILIGINDDKTIGGCKEWTEQKIHTTIHDSITPVPIFDVKNFIIDDKIVLILKIEEGPIPPYITNKGLIYERVSSGSFPIKDSSKLAQLYQKSNDQIEKTRQKIELPSIRIDRTLPANLCGYVDLGFSMTLSETSYFQKHFYDYDLDKICALADELWISYNISRVGYSYIITAGELKPIQKTDKSDVIRLNNGVQNFIEIMRDGSVRARAIIAGNMSDNSADILSLNVIHDFANFYKLFLQNDLPQKFIYAQKYQKLTVLKQFVANSKSAMESGNNFFLESYHKHTDKFGEPLIIEGNRIPAADFQIIDQRSIEQSGDYFNLDTLVDHLFENAYEFVGYTSL